jgi:polar amino acid transport system substrate-binding protein
MMAAFLFVCGCEERKGDDNTIVFGTSADYPPYEFYKDGNIVGFDIDLANAVARELGKTAKFKDMSFSSMFSSLKNGTIDVAVASITPTNERRELYDFTRSYYTSTVALVYKRSNGKPDIEDLAGKKVACQLGSTQELWAKKEWLAAEIVPVDNALQAAEMVRGGKVDWVLLDGLVAAYLCRENKDLDCFIVTKLSETGTSMAAKKGAQITERLDWALAKLTSNGELQRIKAKWNMSSSATQLED